MSDNERRGWRVLSSAYPIDTPFLRLRSDVVELPDGTVVRDYYVRESHGFCVIFALTPDERVVLVRQYKHGAGRDVLELPAGAIEPGETPSVCALRELAEETGYAGAEPELVASFLTDPTSSDGTFYVYVVRQAVERFVQAFDATEDIALEFAGLHDVRAMVRDGRIVTGSQVASIYASLDYLQLL